MWRRFCKAIDREDLIEHPSYATPKDRRNHRDELKQAHRRDHWHADEQRGGRAAQSSEHSMRAIYTIDQTFADPQVRHLGITQNVDSPTLGSIKLVGALLTNRLGGTTGVEG